MRTQHYFDLGVTPFSEGLDGALTAAVADAVHAIELRIDTGDAPFAVAVETLRELEALLPDSHLVLARAHLDVVRAGTAHLQEHSGRRGDDVTDVAIRALRSCLTLPSRMAQYAGVNHTQVADVAEDTEMLIAFLLSRELFCRRVVCCIACASFTSVTRHRQCACTLFRFSRLVAQLSGCIGRAASRQAHQRTRAQLIQCCLIVCSRDPQRTVLHFCRCCRYRVCCCWCCGRHFRQCHHRQLFCTRYSTITADAM